jgi:hypothetical protein
VGEVEDLLLRDPSAVRKVFRKIIADEMPAALSEWDRTWTAINVSEFINRRRGDVVGIKGSKVLIDLANEMGFHYRKPHHGPAIAAEIDPGVIQDLLPLFGGLFTDG